MVNKSTGRKDAVKFFLDSRVSGFNKRTINANGGNGRKRYLIIHDRRWKIIITGVSGGQMAKSGKALRAQRFAEDEISPGSCF